MKKQAMDRCLGLAAVLALAGSGVLAAAQGQVPRSRAVPATR